MIELNFEPFPELKTPRLLLRKLKPSDASDIFYLRTNKRILTHLHRKPETNKHQIVRYIHQMNAYTGLKSLVLWGIRIKGKTQVIGTICLWNIDAENHRGEVGFVLNPRYQRKGYMTEALRAVLEFAFAVNNFNTISGYVSPENNDSIKLLTKSGFKREAHFRESVYYNNEFLDMYVYGIRRKDFLKSAAAKNQH